MGQKSVNQTSYLFTARRAFGVLLTATLCVWLAGCGLLPDKDKDDIPENWPEKKLYFAAKDRLNAGSCNGAIDYYEKLQARYPFGTYAPQAQLELPSTPAMRRRSRAICSSMIAPGLNGMRRACSCQRTR